MVIKAEQRLLREGTTSRAPAWIKRGTEKWSSSLWQNGSLWNGKWRLATLTQCQSRVCTGTSLSISASRSTDHLHAGALLQSVLMTPSWLQTGFSSMESQRGGLNPHDIPVWVRIQLCCAARLNCTEEFTHPVILESQTAHRSFIYTTARPHKTYLSEFAFLPPLRQWRGCAVLGRHPNCPHSQPYEPPRTATCLLLTTLAIRELVSVDISSRIVIFTSDFHYPLVTNITWLEKNNWWQEHCWIMQSSVCQRTHSVIMETMRSRDLCCHVIGEACGVR